VICVVAIGQSGAKRESSTVDNLGASFYGSSQGADAGNGVRTGTHNDTKNVGVADAVAIKSQISNDQERFRQTWRSSAGCLREPELAHLTRRFARIFRDKRGLWTRARFFARRVDLAADVCVAGAYCARPSSFGVDRSIGQGIYASTNSLCKVVATLIPKGQSLSGQDQDDTIIILHHGRKKKSRPGQPNPR